MSIKTKIFKIIVVGDSGIGKSNLLMAYTGNDEEEHKKYVFDSTHASTIGIDFRFKVIKKEDEIIKLQLWDTAGQEIFNSITNNYYKGANGVIIMYDITDAQSFENTVKWIKVVSDINPDVKKILVGTKLDLAEQRCITYQEAIEFANANNMMYVEVSAKTYENVESVFEKILYSINISENHIKEIVEEKKDVIKLENNTKKRNRYKCC